ncbi:DoxX-like family protein [Dyadobacter soli]|uniref:DoxX-like family protein n=1 Tax=Dyadobacter soli TaxID=659014 RepID=A0A1G7W4S3_9BACT|nr:DoxX family protein [Dyadobacter soli]SDG66933.1 DoxX-like family protein [Dyadobacter soli]
MSIRKTSKWLHTALWITQVSLSVTLVWASYMKLFQSPEMLSAMWPWAGQVPPVLVKATGVIDLLAGLGLVLPALLNIRAGLTFVAAAGVVLLMLCAMAFHLSRGESPVFNVVFAAFGGFVAWGRQQRAASLC